MCSIEMKKKRSDLAVLVDRRDVRVDAAEP